MPHPSSPVDDVRAHSSYREHTVSQEQIEDVRHGSLGASGWPAYLACELCVCLMELLLGVRSFRYLRSLRWVLCLCFDQRNILWIFFGVVVFVLREQKIFCPVSCQRATWVTSTSTHNFSIPINPDLCMPTTERSDTSWKLHFPNKLH